MKEDFYKNLQNSLDLLKEQDKFKKFLYLKSPMSGHVVVEDHKELIVLCSNNYIGLANKDEIISQGIKALKKYGTGASSVRFICGTYDIHRELEKRHCRFFTY